MGTIVGTVYGLTGGIACGKTSVARRLVERGAAVVDADDVARAVVAPGTDGLAAIVERFGDGVLTDDGALARDRLGALVFGDEAARADLEAILHPRIAAESARRIGGHLAAGVDLVFYDAALLVETGRHTDFAGLVVVACDPQTQIERVCARDGLTVEAARARIDAQLPVSAKVAVADHVIHNDGPIEALDAAVDDLLERLRSADS